MDVIFRNKVDWLIDSFLLWYIIIYSDSRHLRKINLNDSVVYTIGHQIGNIL